MMRMVELSSLNSFDGGILAGVRFADQAMNTCPSDKIIAQIAAIAEDLQAKARPVKRMGLVAPAAPTIRADVVYKSIKPAGYPIAPEDLDFGGGNPTPVQIANASSFAALMNQIPNAGQPFWTSSGMTVWNVWKIALESAEVPVNGSSGVFHELKGRLRLAERSDMKGDIYYPTFYSPSSFWTETTGQWRPLEAAVQPDGTSDQMVACSSGGTPRRIAFDASGMEVSGELMLVTLLRDWWAPWLFDSKAWRFAPGTIAPRLSDGKTPPTGSMPMYANAFMVARNVKVGVDMDKGKNAVLAKQIQMASALAWGPFQLKGTSHGGRESALRLTTEGIHSPGMQIVGFSCNVLPKCPDPDPALDWPS